MKNPILYIILFALIFSGCSRNDSGENMVINDQGYIEKQGLSVLVFHDFYPMGKQGGIEIIQNGERVATNGFLRLALDDGRRFTYPERAAREVDSVTRVIKAHVNHEDLGLGYTLRVKPEGKSIRISVDLDKPVAAEWENKLTFAMEFYPPLYYGKSFRAGESFGIIPRQILGSKYKDAGGNYRPVPMGHGRKVTFASEDPERRIIIENPAGDLLLVDDRNTGFGGWINVSSVVPAGATENAVEWIITPDVLPGWKKEPVIAVSQVGYHPDQQKVAVIELDSHDGTRQKASLLKLNEKGAPEEVLASSPEEHGKFLRYNYLEFDFSKISEPGMYMIKYGDKVTHPFAISRDIYSKGVWQPTLEGYFPVQMCHVKVKDRQQIWHGACHLDDALQVPADLVHVDAYRQYAAKETNYPAMTTVLYLNVGGWHDAGDDDLAAGSQASTTQSLVLAYELTKNQNDQTLVNFDERYVEMYRPDGIPDFVQQIKQGALNLLSGYRAAGHSFHGIIANREGRNITYDWASQTDQLFYDSRLRPGQKTMTHSSVNDDRLAFTNRDTGLEYQVASALAAASRSLAGYDDKLAAECLKTAIGAWDFEQSHEPALTPAEYVPGNTKVQEIICTSELYFTTGAEKYAAHLMQLLPEIEKNIRSTAWCIARISDRIKNDDFTTRFSVALQDYKTAVDSTLSSNPFGVPWNPAIWGVGWNIQDFAMEYYYLVEKYPDMFDREPLLRVVNYVLGCHPGSNISLVSGVGARSVTVAFGVNRTQEYYIPGGMVSGTALIRPDFPELKETTPYLWQQTEYVMGGAASYIFCVIAADKLLNRL